MLSVDPLCLYGGRYESDRTAAILDDATAAGELQTLLRLKELRGLVLWSLLSAVALANLVYASSLAPTATTWDAAAVVAVVVTGLVILGIVAYACRGWLLRVVCRRCRGCCCCCQRRAGKERASTPTVSSPATQLTSL